MPEHSLFTHPYGTRITTSDIVDDLSFFDDWEERYRYIIDLGKQLADFPSALRTEVLLVRGCQSQVWLLTEQQPDGRLAIAVDSDALIVRGLAAIVLAAYHGKTANEIEQFDIENYFAQLDLLKHLSPTRGNGLRAMVKKIQQQARAAI